jgi:hypothetical protein
MKPYATPVALTATLLLAACGGTGDTGLAGKTIAQARTAENALIDRVDDVIVAEGLTDFVDLPGSGTPTYTGIIHGFNGGGDGPDLEYFADLTLTANFSNDTVGGNVKNFVTDLPGFANPSGTAPVTGTITNDAGLAGIGFGASGTLTSGSTTAAYSTVTTSGTFAGFDADVAFGDHESDFLWLAGPNAGTTSLSDGDWNVER